MKNRIYQGTTLEQRAIIDLDALEEYGSTTLDFYEIEEGHFLLKFAPDEDMEGNS